MDDHFRGPVIADVSEQLANCQNAASVALRSCADKYCESTSGIAQCPTAPVQIALSSEVIAVTSNGAHDKTEDSNEAVGTVKNDCHHGPFGRLQI